ISVTYTYDVEGHKVQEDRWKTGVGTTTTRWAWDGEEVWADLDGSNAVQVRYTHNAGIDRPLSRTVTSGANAGLAFYLRANLGPVGESVKKLGVVNYHGDPGGFGAMVEYGASYGDRIKFTARELDPDTGLQYNRARWYAASFGRWIIPDPLAFGAGDANLYRYVGNNSTNLTDPIGLAQTEIPLSLLVRPALANLKKTRAKDLKQLGVATDKWLDTLDPLNFSISKSWDAFTNMIGKVVVAAKNKALVAELKLLYALSKDNTDYVLVGSKAGTKTDPIKDLTIRL